MLRRIPIAVLVLSAASAPTPSIAQMDVWPNPIVQETVFQIPLWMPPFETEEPAFTGPMQRLEQVVFGDFEFSGLFKVVRRAAASVGMDKTNYSVEVHGKVTRESGTMYFEGWVTDVVSGDFLGGKKYRVPDKSVRRVAHHFADEVVRLVTGEQGIASTRIVYVRKGRQQWELVISDYDGYSPRVLVRQGMPLLNPRWADKNTAIIYTSYRGGKPDLYIRYLTESKSTSLASYSGLNYAADWSDRRRLALVALSKDGNSEIYVLEKSGTIRGRLTHNRAIDTAPCWSPSGREIVFVSDRSGRPQLYVMENDGGNLRRLTFTGGYNATPAWSPRGDLIAFVARMGSEFQIATITPDGRDGRLLTKSSRSHEDPRWAPDGRHIVYTERGAGD
ncbi:MAG: PD40 domain-containing protein, partial [Candidatus Krumholzibacteriota bacterium]|nr:PD40 domain-containing protein [Candidatus Krumholzibacteriota bacterium]